MLTGLEPRRCTSLRIGQLSASCHHASHDSEKHRDGHVSRLPVRRLLVRPVSVLERAPATKAQSGTFNVVAPASSRQSGPLRPGVERSKRHRHGVTEDSAIEDSVTVRRRINVQQETDTERRGDRVAIQRSVSRQDAIHGSTAGTLCHQQHRFTVGACRPGEAFKDAQKQKSPGKPGL